MLESEKLSATRFDVSPRSKRGRRRRAQRTPRAVVFNFDRINHEPKKEAA